MPRNPCDRVLEALKDCERKHSSVIEKTACEHLHRSAGWCLIRQVCSEEGTESSMERDEIRFTPLTLICACLIVSAACLAVNGLEDCIGKPRKWVAPPSSVPEKCMPHVIRLEACLSTAQSLQ
jgi:hypothetical protein